LQPLLLASCHYEEEDKKWKKEISSFFFLPSQKKRIPKNESIFEEKTQKMRL
jgi:hypothetical protein